VAGSAAEALDQGLQLARHAGELARATRVCDTPSVVVAAAVATPVMLVAISAQLDETEDADEQRDEAGDRHGGQDLDPQWQGEQSGGTARRTRRFRSGGG
jgi:hypothetical protein